MQLIKIDPPGTLCQYSAIFDLLKHIEARTFLEVGCGSGNLSLKLCREGLVGYGLDLSDQAVKETKANLAGFIKSRKYEVFQGDIREVDLPKLKQNPVDLVICMMVLEHIENEASFLSILKRYLNPGGHLILGVPARIDKWNIEDETVGHLRRYERDDIEKVLKASEFSIVELWSVSVPIANILYSLGNYLLSKSDEASKKYLNKREQTEVSGLQVIPFKTHFPKCFKLVLNEYTMYPFFLLQRFFYKTSLGLTIICLAKLK